MSSIDSVPISYFIYSSFSFYAPSTSGEISGPWFVRALGALGRTPAAVRMEIYRMEQDGELVSRREGRTKFYRLTTAARAEVDAGYRKIFGKPPGKWNGDWTMLHFQFTADQRAQRDRLRSLLHVEGFASIGSGLFLHPRPPSDGLKAAIQSLNAPGQVTLFTNAHLEQENPREFVASTWQLDSLAKRYNAFRSRFASMSRRSKPVTGLNAFVTRFAVVFDYLDAAWADPELPPELLPASWPANDAKKLAQSLYKNLLPEAIRYAKSLDQ